MIPSLSYLMYLAQRTATGRSRCVLALLAALGSPNAGSAQVLSGRVVAEETGEPIAGALVVAADSISGDAFRTHSDSVGLFRFDLAELRTGAAAAHALGFHPSRPQRFSLQDDPSGLVIRLRPQFVDGADQTSSFRGTRLTGRVWEAGNGRVVSQAEVTLTLESSGETRIAVSDAAGRFGFPDVVPLGAVSVTATALGYETSTPASIALETATTFLDLELEADAIQLPQLSVTVRARESRLDRLGVTERKRIGAGEVYLEEELEPWLQASGGRLAQVFRRIPGWSVTRGGEPVSLRGLGAQPCIGPDVWIDGAPVRSGGLSATPGPTLDARIEAARGTAAGLSGRGSGVDAGTISGGLAEFDLLVPPPEMIGAIEAYASAAVPADFRSYSSHCGVILIWTREGGRQRDKPAGRD